MRERVSGWVFWDGEVGREERRGGVGVPWLDGVAGYGG